MPGVEKVLTDMCCYNLTTTGNNGEVLVKKPTYLLTNSTIMARHLARRCNGSHKHGQLKGGQRCHKAAVCTAEFCKAICEGYKKHWQKHGKKMNQRSSLKARDFLDSDCNTLQIGEDDPEDVPILDELLDNGCLDHLFH